MLIQGAATVELIFIERLKASSALVASPVRLKLIPRSNQSFAVKVFGSVIVLMGPVKTSS
jgi:hypothetical protein